MTTTHPTTVEHAARQHLPATERTEDGKADEATDQTAADYLEHPLKDLNQTRQDAQAEMRAAIGSAAERTREVLHELKET